MVDGLTARVEGDVSGTVLSLYGTLDTAQSGMLRELLDMAYALRHRGPIVVDLAGVNRLGADALVILRRAADQASRAGRSLTIHSVRTDQLADPRGARLLRALWPGVTDAPTPPHRPSRRSRPRRTLAGGAVGRR
jgi:anti-anti-sigma regulatory factor